MQKLFAFIADHKHWFLFIVLELISLTLLFNDGFYRRGLRFYVYSGIVGRASEAVSEVGSYISLREKNEYLLSEKARLEHELTSLRRAISDQEAEEGRAQLSLESLSPASYVTARIISLSAHIGDTYYMINKGRSSGIRPDMAVMSTSGVVGTILEVSDSYALVIPITNSKLKLSCAIRGKDYQGQLISSGRREYGILGGLSLHADLSPGDTVQTSGYSYIFPEGALVGTIEELDREGVSANDAVFATYRVKLATDFERLSYVYVDLSVVSEEIRQLEQVIAPN